MLTSGARLGRGVFGASHVSSPFVFLVHSLASPVFLFIIPFGGEMKNAEWYDMHEV